MTATAYARITKDIEALIASHPDPTVAAYMAMRAAALRVRERQGSQKAADTIRALAAEILASE